MGDQLAGRGFANVGETVVGGDDIGGMIDGRVAGNGVGILVGGWGGVWGIGFDEDTVAGEMFKDIPLARFNRLKKRGVEGEIGTPADETTD